jgi:beta-lactamase regulating signal transducer with metallopeptidase domain
VASNTGSAVTSNPVSDFAASHAPNVGVSKNSVLWVGGALLLILALLTEYLILSRRMRRKYEKN